MIGYSQSSWRGPVTALLTILGLWIGDRIIISGIILNRFKDDDDRVRYPG